MDTKYLVVFPVVGPAKGVIEAVMERVAEISGKVPVNTKLPPHITLHPPIQGITRSDLVDLVAFLVRRERGFNVATSVPTFFGKELYVLPIESQPLALARLWSGLYRGVVNFLGQKSGPYDDFNTLHITLGDGLSKASQATHHQLASLIIPRLELLLDMVVVYEKVAGGVWNPVKTFVLPTAS